MMHHLTGGRWGVPIRRPLEAALSTLPLMALLFIPVLIGIPALYPWAQKTLAAGSELLQKRHAYLNYPGFIIRTAFIFGVWIWMASALAGWSWKQDAAQDVRLQDRLRKLSGPGLVIYPLTATFAYVDWIMSLETEWFSTIFPIVVMIGQMLAAFSFCILYLAWMRQEKPISEIVSPTHFHHLGNLLLAFVMLWTYVAFGQLLIIYAGNLPHEISWYLHRIAGGWKWVVILLALFHFMVPFLMLLFRTAKRRIQSLAMIAGTVFIAHLINVFWYIAPTFHPHGLAISWMDAISPIGVGGIWASVFLMKLKSHALVPLDRIGLQPSQSHG
jgi:hypothetical protein